jgi:hypothetical protein
MIILSWNDNLPSLLVGGCLGPGLLTTLLNGGCSAGRMSRMNQNKMLGSNVTIKAKREGTESVTCDNKPILN